MTTATLTDLHWSQRGLCRSDPRLFDGINNTELDRDYAISICRRCPVLDLCTEATRQRTDPLFGVIAGVYYGK